MSRELNKIFDVKSRQARRDILDKFDLSKEDKNKVLNKIGACKNDDKIIYYEVSDTFKNMPIEEFQTIGIFFTHYKLKINNKYAFLSVLDFYDLIDNGSINDLNSKVTMVGFLPIDNTPIYSNEGTKLDSIEEYLSNIDQEPSYLIKRRVTAEEYWNTENIKKLPTFTIAIEASYYTGTATKDMLAYHIKTYEYEPNMTMYDWINSEYNVDNIVNYSERGDGYKAPFYNNGENPFMLVADTNNHLFLDGDKINDFANSSIAVPNISSNNKTVYVNFIAKWYV